MLDGGSIGPLIVSLISVAGFIFVLLKTRAIPIAGGLANIAIDGVSVMLDSSRSDAEKEQAVRASGIKLIVNAWSFLWRFALAIAAVAAPILGADWFGITASADSISVMLSLEFIAAVSVLGIALSWALRRKWGSTQTSSAGAHAYSAGDKFVHALAFSGPGTLKKLARVDDFLFSKTVQDLPDRPPIFITSLARGGTTALLNALHELPQIATHRYCDMPFISAPLLWSKLPGHGGAVTERPRAHGDGLTISSQSPEAFDEIFWRLHWPEKYHDQTIDLWSSTDTKGDAHLFFQRHFRKIIKLRHPHSTADVPIRYLSKNNANIARLELLPLMFPGCDIIVPLRGPAAHAASLLRQHQNFTKLHAEDPFATRYMRDLGHLEFGALQSSMNFSPNSLEPYDPMQADYWLAYWITAFEHVAANGDTVHFVTQDALRLSPNKTIHTLLERLGIDPNSHTDFTSYFHNQPDVQPTDLFDPTLMRQAQKLYEKLSTLALK